MQISANTKTALHDLIARLFSLTPDAAETFTLLTRSGVLGTYSTPEEAADALDRLPFPLRLTAEVRDDNGLPMIR